MSRYTKSLELWEKSKNSLVPGSSTISKAPFLYTLGAYPIYLQEGRGVIVTDLDGNTYIDFQSGLGAIILGMSYDKVNRAVQNQLSKGSLFSLASPLPIKLAELICATVPSAERVRILKNGSDATSAAIRIARAFTGRNKIASCHFHGWHDWYYITTSMNKGIPKKLKEDIYEFKYNDIKSLEKIFDEHKNEIAAVILEPVHLEEPKDNFLEKVKELAHKHGALLIFDEVVTGFRFSLGGAQQYFNIIPDLSCFAKALANGFPLSAVAGKAEILDATSDVITSMTYGEETLSIAASLATIQELQEKPVIEHIWKLGALFKLEYNKLAQKYGIPTVCIGYPCRLELTFSDYKNNERKRVKGYFLQESAKQGIIFGNIIFMTYSHTEEQIRQALQTCEKIFKQLASLTEEGKEQIKLEGKIPVELW